MNASKSAGRAGDRAAKIGLRDLARLAGVDVSTVSRALNHDPRINAARGKVIRDLARREGYRPRPLRAKRTQAIGVLIGSDQPEPTFSSMKPAGNVAAWRQAAAISAPTPGRRK